MAIKKTTKKVVAKPVAKAMPSAEMPCKCGPGCKCHGGHFFKKLIVLLIVFAAGFAVCHFGCQKGFHGKRMMMMKNMFVEGCLDMSKIKCPLKAEKMAQADLNGDGCITKEELRTFWKEKRNAVENNDAECEGESEE
ncbi:MAG: EF-hand domain-containing protein [Alphaproteobacteria bacterium]|nr:EF-hand domain-containing protein [Alphaproteobacteria bacterium]